MALQEMVSQQMEPLMIQPSARAPLARPDSVEINDLEAFEDALEPSMDLRQSLADCQLAIEKFFSNDVKAAVDVMEPWREKSLYHSHGAAIFEFIPAMLTLEPQQVQKALAAVKETCQLCNRLRRQFNFVESLGTIIKKPNWNGYSELEAHAELIHAEALLVQASLLAIESEDFTGLLRATLRIKNSHNSYKDCVKILEKKQWEDPESKVHFESGVRLGVATFNVMISLLPPKVIALLEFVGFSGDKEFGLAELMIGARSPGLRSILCTLTLLVHTLVIGQFAAIPPDYELAQTLIEENLTKYPNSAWFLMFKGRLELLLGKPQEAIQTYELASSTEGLWPQLIHLAYWETMWAHAMMSEWKESASFATKLLEESLWSRTIYAYVCVAAALHLDDAASQYINIMDMIKAASNYRQRIMGRSVPMEKFALKRCARLRMRGRLTLPVAELLCIWNMYPAIAKDKNLADSMLKLIEDAQKTIEAEIKNKTAAADAVIINLPQVEDKREPSDFDDLALIKHLRGSLLSAMNYPRLALKYLEEVISLKDKIKENSFLIPYTMVEIAMCHHTLGDPDKAMKTLQEARKKTGYAMESRLQFRIHSKIEIIRNNQKAAPPSLATHAGVRAKMDIPATLGTQGNLVSVTHAKEPASKTDEKEAASNYPEEESTDLEQINPSKNTPTDLSPVAGTSRDIHDTVITTEGVQLVPKSKLSPELEAQKARGLSMAPPKDSK
ncbi:tetratricopeptide repeat protein 39B-like isoform X2 [Leptidea sinapis]|nr:tetratricopeptide repeat protein 39B-like isoform X2 [Leptidea sinapis]XP_050683676.1 tetratricopeptide repeat protein 39B-like isoform X2 [Leptidea sinapis]